MPRRWLPAPEAAVCGGIRGVMAAAMKAVTVTKRAVVAKKPAVVTPVVEGEDVTPVGEDEEVEDVVVAENPDLPLVGQPFDTGPTRLTSTKTPICTGAIRSPEGGYSHVMVGNELVFILGLPVAFLAESVTLFRRMLAEEDVYFPIRVSAIYNLWMDEPVCCEE